MVASSNETVGTLFGLSNDLADAVENAGKSIVAIAARRHTPATGIHWREGIVVAADHTIEREDNITVTLPDGRNVQATIAGRDPGTDIAVLRIEGGNFPVAQIGDSSTLRVGHIVLAVARPGETGLSASWGAVSAIGEAWRTWAGGQIDRLVRPDLTLYPGFSGGPLVNAAGEVVGLNTSGLSRNMTLTIPVSTVNRVVEQLVTRGRISRGYIGVALQAVSLPENLVQSNNLQSSGGLIVISVENGGPAEKAGLMVGDILINLDGSPVASTDDVQSALDANKVGQAIPVRIVRGGSATELSLTVGERPQRGE